MRGVVRFGSEKGLNWSGPWRGYNLDGWNLGTLKNKGWLREGIDWRAWDLEGWNSGTMRGWRREGFDWRSWKLER
jgi:hypothetical protein